MYIDTGKERNKEIRVKEVVERKDAQLSFQDILAAGSISNDIRKALKGRSKKPKALKRKVDIPSCTSVQWNM